MIHIIIYHYNHSLIIKNERKDYFLNIVLHNIINFCFFVTYVRRHNEKQNKKTNSVYFLKLFLYDIKEVFFFLTNKPEILNISKIIYFHSFSSYCRILEFTFSNMTRETKTPRFVISLKFQISWNHEMRNRLKSMFMQKINRLQCI